MNQKLCFACALMALAAIKAWPAMYTDGELNPTCAALIDHDATDIIQLLRALEDAGVDVRGSASRALSAEAVPRAYIYNNVSSGNSES